MEQSEAQHFCVCPHDTAKGFEKWAMFHAVIAREVQPKSRYVPYFNFREFDAALKENKLRWGYLNPAQFLDAQRDFGFELVARPRGRPDRSLVVRASGASLDSLDALRGKRIAAAPGYLFALAKHELRARGVDFAHVPVRSYTEVLQAIAKGEADAGVTYNEHFDALADATRAQFEVLHVVDSGLSHVVCAHPSMPADVRERLQAFLLGAHENPAARKALDAVDIVAFEAAEARPFEALAAILAST